MIGWIFLTSPCLEIRSGENLMFVWPYGEKNFLQEEFSGLVQNSHVTVDIYGGARISE